MPGPSFDPIARRQHGLVTSAQLHSIGWTEKQIRHAVRAALLEPLRRSVFRAAGSPRTQQQAWLAAALAAVGTVLSHLTATQIWRYPFFPQPAGIDLLRLGSRPRLEGVVGHQTDDLPASHVRVRDRLPVTSACRTLIDTCGLVTPAQLSSAANDGLRRRSSRCRCSSGRSMRCPGQAGGRSFP